LGSTNKAAFTISLSLAIVGCPLATSRPLRAQPPRKTSPVAENKNDMLIRNSQVKIPYSRSSGPWRCIERLSHPTWYRNGSYVSALANKIHHGLELFAPRCLPDKPNRNTKEGLSVPQRSFVHRYLLLDDSDNERFGDLATVELVPVTCGVAGSASSSQNVQWEAGAA
jgi:hypothetical protein